MAGRFPLFLAEDRVFTQGSMVHCASKYRILFWVQDYETRQTHNVVDVQTMLYQRQNDVVVTLKRRRVLAGKGQISMKVHISCKVKTALYSR